MGEPREPRLTGLFRAVVSRRWLIVVAYALALVPAVYFALRVKQDNAIDRLIVESDPDYITAKQFEKVFGSGEYVVLLAEAPDPFAPDVLARFDRLEHELQTVPRIEENSVLTVYRRARAGFSATPDEARRLREFATGTDLFRKQGMIGDHFLVAG